MANGSERGSAFSCLRHTLPIAKAKAPGQRESPIKTEEEVPEKKKVKKEAMQVDGVPAGLQALIDRSPSAPGNELTRLIRAIHSGQRDQAVLSRRTRILREHEKQVVSAFKNKHEILLYSQAAGITLKSSAGVDGVR